MTLCQVLSLMSWNNVTSKCNKSGIQQIYHNCLLSGIFYKIYLENSQIILKDTVKNLLLKPERLL